VKGGTSVLVSLRRVGIFSGFFFFLFPVVAPRGADWWQFLRPRGPLTLSDLPFILLDLLWLRPLRFFFPHGVSLLP